MPTFTAIALDSLLEPACRNPNPPPPPVRLQRQVSASEKKSIPPRPPNSISPILYATPDVTPLPDSPSSFSPSPYIINHKRRAPRQGNVVVDEPRPAILDPKAEATNMTPKVEGEAKGGKLEEVGNGAAHVSSENGVVGKEKTGKSVAAVEAERDVELDDFLDFQDSKSTASSSEMDDRSWKPTTPMTEYYDAFEEISSDGDTKSSSSRNVEDELREMRLNLLMEIEKRKQSEEALENLQNQWQSLSHHLSLVGLTLPTLPAITEETGKQPNLDPAEDLCRQVVIARTVAGSIGRACARAEFEMEMEPQIKSKNFEIARLGDRLQYYEAANREMSQRNQEAVEMARQERYRRKRRQRWIWGSIGLAVTLGAAAIAWSYVPDSKPSPRADEIPTSQGD